MAITVKHKFVSAIPDAGDPTIVQPSNWNDDHQLTGTVPVANGGTGASDASTALTNLGAYPASNPSGYGTGTVTSVAGTGTVNGITLTGTVTSSGSLTLGGTLGSIGNSQLTNSSITFGSTAASLGSTVSALNGVSVGATTASTGAFTYLSTSGSTSTTPTLSFNGSNSPIASGATISGSYLQFILQNKSGTAGASTNYVLSNDLGTDSSYYGEFGMNSSVYSASTPADFFSLNNGIYFSGHDGDLTIGSGNGYKTYLAWGTTGQSAHVINASGAIGLNTNITGTTNFGTSGQVLTSAGSAATPTWTTPATGTVTSVSVATANGFAGTVANASTTPAITISTGITGVLKGNGTAISAATAGTDYSAGTSANASGLVYSTTTTGALTTATGAQVASALGSTNITGSAANVTGIVAGANGGTGVANTGSTITVGGNLTHDGAFTQSFTATANTAVTLPAGATASSNNLLSSATAVGIVTGTPSSTTYLRGDGTWATVSSSGAAPYGQITTTAAGWNLL
jgi:hypothetical protein